MNRRITGMLAATAVVGLLVVGVAEPSFANTKSGGALTCSPSEVVKISWKTTGVTGSRPYYNTSNGWVSGGWYTTATATYNTGKRVITGWQVIADGTLVAASTYAYCALA